MLGHCCCCCMCCSRAYEPCVVRPIIHYTSHSGPGCGLPPLCMSADSAPNRMCLASAPCSITRSILCVGIETPVMLTQRNATMPPGVCGGAVEGVGAGGAAGGCGAGSGPRGRERGPGPRAASQGRGGVLKRIHRAPSFEEPHPLAMGGFREVRAPGRRVKGQEVG